MVTHLSLCRNVFQEQNYQFPFKISGTCGAAFLLSGILGLEEGGGVTLLFSVAPPHHKVKLVM